MPFPYNGPPPNDYLNSGSQFWSEYKWDITATFSGWADVVANLPDNNTNFITAKAVRDPLWTLWNLVGYALSQVASGFTGPQGFQGRQGPQGWQGFQGRQGWQGIQGLQGHTGSQGFQGNQGRQGWQGIQGPSGDPNGPIGPTGVQGRQGVTGLQGFQGRQGFQGNQGIQGSGVTGIQGYTGVQGSQGNQGFVGPIGLPGVGGTGIQGFQGWQGIGNTGFQGVTGPTGVQGWQGPQGRQGWQGLGNTGYQGVTGPTGATGPVGIQGWQGLTGSGNTGGNAYTYTTLPQTMPPCGGTVSLSVESSSWASIGQMVYVGPNFGYLQVIGPISPTSSILQLMNVCYPGNVPPSTPIPASSSVSPAGIIGATGPQGDFGGPQGFQGITGPQGPFGGPQGLQGLTGVSGISEIFTGNQLWVDSVYGDDGTGIRNRFDLPYLTLFAAQQGATAGDVINVRPGVYYDHKLGKNNIDWNLSEGVTITATNSGSPSASINGYNWLFGDYDRDLALFVTMSYVVSGFANLIASTINNISNCVIYFKQTGSDVHFNDLNISLNPTNIGSVTNPLIAPGSPIIINSDGLEYLIDRSFNAGIGASGSALDIKMDPDGERIYVGGSFNFFNDSPIGVNSVTGFNHHRLVRLFKDGSRDFKLNSTLDQFFTYDFVGATTAGQSVETILVAEDDSILFGLGTTAQPNRGLYKINNEDQKDPNFTHSQVNSQFWNWIQDVTTINIGPDGNYIVGGSAWTDPGSNLVKMSLTGSIVAFGTASPSRGIGFGRGLIAPNEYSRYLSSVITTDNKIVVVGSFTTVSLDGTNGTVGSSPFDYHSNRIVELTYDGTLGATFGAGSPNGTGFDTEYTTCIALLGDGSFIIGGSFSSYNGTSVGKLVKLSTTYSLDSTFNTNIGSGFDGVVKCITIDSQGNLLVGGDFVSLNGNTNCRRMIKLDSGGNLLQDFNINDDPVNGGFDAEVKCITIQPDNRILVGGAFNRYNGEIAQGIIRLGQSTGIHLHQCVVNSIVERTSITATPSIFPGVIYSYDSNITNGYSNVDIFGNISIDNLMSSSYLQLRNIERARTQDLEFNQFLLRGVDGVIRYDYSTMSAGSGFQGRQGSSGGGTGIQGAQGAQGPQGAQGRQGFQGITGSTGVQGNQGFQGITGSQGPGLTGVQGPQGRQGIIGSSLANSLMWYQGLSASAGQFGYTSSGGWNAVSRISPNNFSFIPPISTNDASTWLAEMNGWVTSSNVYLQVQEYGNSANYGIFRVGTMSQQTGYYNIIFSSLINSVGSGLGTSGIVFVLSYVVSGGASGAQGNQGRQGAQGNQGLQGNQGRQGIQGPQGRQGFQGNQGRQGWQGFQGIQGITGPTGFQGVQGPQGNQGFQGVQGPQGNQGFQGVQGPQGNQGFQGITGSTGVQGFQGIQGVQGAQGRQGFQGITGSTGVQGFQGIQGVQGVQGRQGFQGWQGSTGPESVDIKFGFPYTLTSFDVDVDPGYGGFAVNTEEPLDVSVIAVHEVDQQGVDRNPAWSIIYYALPYGNINPYVEIAMENSYSVYLVNNIEVFTSGFANWWKIYLSATHYSPNLFTFSETRFFRSWQTLKNANYVETVNGIDGPDVNIDAITSVNGDSGPDVVLDAYEINTREYLVLMGSDIYGGALPDETGGGTRYYRDGDSNGKAKYTNDFFESAEWSGADFQVICDGDVLFSLEDVDTPDLVSRWMSAVSGTFSDVIFYLQKEESIQESLEVLGLEIKSIQQSGVTGSGAQGFQGAQGRQGFQGIQGITGSTGVQGFQGPSSGGGSGSTGVQGVQGFQGDSNGAQGLQGRQGPVQAFYYNPLRTRVDHYETYGNSYLTVGTLSVLGGYTYSQGKYPAFVGWMEFLGFTQSEILTCYESEAAWNNTIWLGDVRPINAANPAAAINFSNGCQSRIHLVENHGAFKATLPRLIAHGIHEGQGSMQYTDGTLTNTSGGTRITIDHTNWNTTEFPERNIFQGTLYGGGVIGNYQEGMIVKHFDLEGGKTGQDYDSAFVSYGMAFSQLGSVSVIEKIRADGFNDAGLLIDGAIPASVRDCRFFQNNRAGIILKGTALSSVSLDTVEFDDNPVCILLEHGDTQVAGGKPLMVRNLKSECGNNLFSGSPRPQEIAHLTGAFGAVFDGVASAIYDGRVEYAFRLNNLQVGSTVSRYKARLEVRMFYENGTVPGSGYDYLLTDGVHKWSMPSVSTPFSFIWDNTNGGSPTLTCSVALTMSAA